MDRYDVTAEDVYKINHASDDQPPLWLDCVFILVIFIIHISYSFKFTKFSLAYLNAKCEEKKSGQKWTTSRLYLHAIKSERVENKEIISPIISIKLWAKLAIVRHLIRILIFVLCWVVLILYICLQLNILFEYIVACIVNYKHGSLFAFIVFPALIFVNIGVIRYIFYGIMASWSINVDTIADEIAYEQQHNKAKLYALRDTEQITDQLKQSSIFDINNDIVNDLKQDDIDIDENELPETTFTVTPSFQDQAKSAWHIYKETISKFTAPYWMAVHWRLLTVFTCVIATIFALPSMSKTVQKNIDDINSGNYTAGGEMKDSFGFQVFLRYMLIATASWLIIYFFVSVGIGLYGRISTLSVYSGIIYEENRQTKCNRKCNEMLRFFCLLDAFGLEDTNRNWKRCKFIQLTIILFSGIIFVLIWPITRSGLLWFIGVVQIFFYGANVLLTSKPRGIHFLWKSNMIALELVSDIDGDGKEDFTEYKATNQQIPMHIRSKTINRSHAADMAHLSKHQLKKLMGKHSTQRHIFNDFSNNEVETDTDYESDRALIVNQPKQNSDNEISVKLYDESDAELEKEDDGIGSELKNEQEVIALFSKLYNRINNERRKLYEEKSNMTFKEKCLSMRCINLILFFNYFYSVFKQYKGYWLLILPYNYDIRPLSVWCSGRSMSENIIKYNYTQMKWSKTCFKLCKWTVSGLQGLCCVCCCIFGFILLLYISIFVNNTINNSMNMNSISENNNNNITNITQETEGIEIINKPSYPLCDLKWNSNLSVIDLTSLAHMTYDIGDREIEYNISIQEQLCVYFDRKLSSECSWKVINYTTEEPVYIHLRHELNKTDVIAIRGTKSKLDTVQDFSLFNQVALVQLASWIIPITSILPTSFIVRIVYFMSHFEGSIDTHLRARYDEPVFNYAYKLLIDTNYEINSLYFIGHSLGGGISQAVAGQMQHLYDSKWIYNNAKNNKLIENLNIKSFSMASPGMVFNSRKFSIDLHDLFVTATILKPRHDAVSNVDIPGGLVQNMECDQSKFISCHKTQVTICELVDECNIYHSHNPTLIKLSCDDESSTYMAYLNQSITNGNENNTPTTTTTTIKVIK